MVPGKLTVLLKMATPRRYKDPDYMRRIAGDIYGGALRGSPELVRKHLRHVRWSSDYGYCLQLIAGFGWSSGCGSCRNRRWSWREPMTLSCRSPTAASWRNSFRTRAW